ncbi:MAG: transposase, partial [Rhodobacteraceae bacterium]|nr:transposase [Paracoccaceae bacterium]
LRCAGIGPQGYTIRWPASSVWVGQWHPESGARPQLRLNFMLFCGLDLFAPVPDETTHCYFRNPR